VGPLASLRDVELEFLHRVVCDWATPFVDALVPFVDDEWIGASVVVLLLLLVALTEAGRKRIVPAVATLVLTMGVSHGVREVIWKTLPRDRPGKVFPEDRILRGPIAVRTCADHPEMWVERGHPPKSPAFPSSHVLTVASCAVGLWVAARWAGAFLWLYAVAIGYGRMYQGKHWPTDVLGSLLLVALLGWVCARAVRTGLARRAARAAGRPPEEPSAIR
jgi:membrane-associated phospholipid phosphatase